MSDQFPVSSNTPIMTAPAILEWLAGEIEDVNKMKELYTNPFKRGVFAAIAGHLENMSSRFAETTMRGMDGDESAARSVRSGIVDRHDVQAALFKVESIHHIHADQCLCGFRSSVSRDRTKHLMEVTIAAITEEA